MRHRISTASAGALVIVSFLVFALAGGCLGDSGSDDGGGSGESGNGGANDAACAPACSTYENCVASRCHAPDDSSCRGIMHCADSCATEECIASCYGLGDTAAQQLFVGLLECMDATGCTADCSTVWETSCATELDVCTNDGAESGGSGSGQPSAMSAFLAGDWVCPYTGRDGQQDWSFYPNGVFVRGFFLSTDYPDITIGGDGYTEAVQTTFNTGQAGTMGRYEASSTALSLVYAEDGLSDSLTLSVGEGGDTSAPDDDLVTIGSLDCIRNGAPHTATPTIPSGISNATFTVAYGSLQFSPPILETVCSYEAYDDKLEVTFKTFGGDSIETWLFGMGNNPANTALTPFYFSANLRVGLYQYEPVAGSVSISSAQMTQARDIVWIGGTFNAVSAAGDGEEVGSVTVSGSFSEISCDAYGL